MTLTSLTPTPAEDAEIEALRTGLDGLPAGPWRHYRDRLRPNFGGIVNEVQCRSKTPVVAWPGFDDSNRSEPKRALIAAHIARCSPDAIRRVLARLDASKSELASLRRAISDHQDLSRKVAASLQGQLAAESQRCGRWEARALLAESKFAEAKGALALWRDSRLMTEDGAPVDLRLLNSYGGDVVMAASATRATLSNLETQETRHDRHG